MRPQLTQLVECLKLLIERASIWYGFKTTPEQEEQFIEWVRYPKEVETIHLPVVTSTQEDITQTDTVRIADIQAKTARELQRHLDAKRAEPQQNTEPHLFHSIRLQRIQTEEMRVAFPTQETDKWLVI